MCYPVKSTQIFIGCHLEFFRVASTQIFFHGGSLKKVGRFTYKSEKKSGEHPEKNLGRCYPKKSHVAPYKNLGRFYRVPFKALIRLQIKWASVVRDRDRHISHSLAAVQAVANKK